LGSDNLAARGVCSTIIGFAFFIFGFLTDGITSRVAAALGKGNKFMVGVWIKIALMAGAASGILCGAVFGASYKGWISLFGQSHLDAITTPYYFVRLAGLSFNLLFNAVTGVLQGLQMVWVVLSVNIFLCTVDVVCNYLFMFTLGWSIIGGPLGIGTSLFAWDQKKINSYPFLLQMLHFWSVLLLAYYFSFGPLHERYFSYCRGFRVTLITFPAFLEPSETCWGHCIWPSGSTKPTASL
jgi:hypothetical protein